MSDHRKFWVYKVTGGEDVDLQVKGNPVLKYRTPLSILRSVSTSLEASEIAQAFKDQGCQVEYHSPEESEEQKIERKSVFAVFGDGVTFPTASCPQCPWLDPLVEGLCGLGAPKQSEGWGQFAIEERLKVDSFRSAKEVCPLLNPGDT
jgi:hypothetical protein